MTISSSSGLSDSEIEKMVKQSEAFAEQDKARRELIEMSVGSESTCTDTQRTLDEFKDKLAANEVEALQTHINELREL